MTTEPGPLPAAAIDHRTVDWPRVRRSTYHLQQRLTYEYPGPIADLEQRLVVVPARSYGGQRLLDYRIETREADAAGRREERDRFGNRVLRLSVPRVERRVEFSVTLELQRIAGGGPATVPASEAAHFLEETPLTSASGALADAARRLARLAGGDPEADAALINRRVFQALRYERGVSGVKTTAADAFAQGAGVCQDYAHVMLALCRLSGIPARYVSGHLLGEGGTHAWVEALLPSPDQPGTLVARAFDPTHGRLAGITYITIATGRDYRDVAPTTGTFSAPYGGTLTARKVALVTSVEYEDGVALVPA